VLYSHIASSTELVQLLDQRNHNITFLLPNEQAMNTSIGSGLLNFSSPQSFSQLSVMILNGSFPTHSYLSSHRQFYPTISNHNISIGPQIVNNALTNTIEIYSGMSKAITTATEIQCLNGIIQYIDHFLQPAQTPLDTISTLSETEYMEGLLKSLNVSDVISGGDKTILVPVNEAWEATNGSTLPYGTLVHNLKYAVLDGLYTSDKILAGINSTTHEASFSTDYKQKPIVFRLEKEELWINAIARFVKTDILTTAGVIHLIDTVLTADTVSIETANKTFVPVLGTDNHSSPDRRGSLATHVYSLHPLYLFSLSLLFVFL
ncbi:hypothetical protein INT47_003819, partial [Mucor saturninus]